MAFRDDHEAALARADALETELELARRDADASKADAAARVAALEKQVAELRATPAPAPAPSPSVASEPRVPESAYPWGRAAAILCVLVIVIGALIYRRARQAERYERTPEDTQQWLERKRAEDCRLCRSVVRDGSSSSFGKHTIDPCAGCP